MWLVLDTRGFLTEHQRTTHFIRMGLSLKTLRTSASQSYASRLLLMDEIPTAENSGLHLQFGSKYNGSQPKILKSPRS